MELLRDVDLRDEGGPADRRGKLVVELAVEVPERLLGGKVDPPARDAGVAADPHVVDPHQLDRVLDVGDVVVQRGPRLAAHEEVDRRHPHDAALSHQLPDLLVALAARVVVRRPAVGVGEDDRLLGDLDGVQGGAHAAVGEVHQHP